MRRNTSAGIGNRGFVLVKRRTTRLIALLLAGMTVAAGAAISAEPPQAGKIEVSLEEPDYRDLVGRCAAIWSSGYSDSARLLERGHIRRVAEMAGTLAHLWQWTGEPQYAEQSRHRLQAILDMWEARRKPAQPWKQLCFFSVYPIMDAYRILDAGSQLDAPFRDRFRRFVPEGYFALERGAFNQAFARAAGLALAARQFPDLPEAAGWRAYANDVWNDWYQDRDTTENAAVYNAISLTYIFLLADALDRTGDLDDPAVRQMFRRFRDQVTPSGMMPQYGDSGDYPWQVFHAWGNWVAAFERAARDYRDPRERWAALRMFHAATRYRPLAQRSYAVESTHMVYALTFADQWRDRSIRPEIPQVGSAVLVRREPGNSRVADKLILAPSRAPGAPFVMAELYSRWHHAHDNQWGSILHYESDGSALLYGLGYHNRAPEHANLVLICPADEPFPHKTPVVAPGVWQEASLAARRLPPMSPNGNEADLRHFDRVTFRVAEPNPVDLWVDNLRLSGPAGEKVLDDFEQLRRWHGGQRSLVDDAVQGRHAMRIACKPGIQFIWRDGFNTTFSLRDYDHIKFSWKMSGVQGGWSNSLLFRMDTSLSDYHVPIRQLLAVVQDARAESRGGDQFGMIRLGEYFTDDTQLTRRLVLLAEGSLVVCDDLEPGPQADGQVAGPLWHLHGELTSGDHWFDAPAGQRRLLVWCAPGPERSFGLQTVELWGRVRPTTVFAKQPLRANRPVRFITVLVPHAGEQSASGLAGQITAATNAVGVSTLRLGWPARPVQVRIPPAGPCRVERK